MTDEEKTKEQLIEELTFMRRQIAELEATESKRKLAEDALRESEESFRQVAENTKKSSGSLTVTSRKRSMSVPLTKRYGAAHVPAYLPTPGPG